MKGHRSALLIVAAGLLCSCGTGCQILGTMCGPAPVRVLPQSPTLQQVVDVVNRNNSAINSFSTTEARLWGPGFMSLKANLAFQRPGLLRLRGDSVMGAELDLGSNQELFWFWARRNEPQALYFCRHDQFSDSTASSAVPIDPKILIEALGTAVFDPASEHQGPAVLPGERLQIRTIRQSPQGPTTKITVIDGIQGFVLEQHMYDAAGQLVASSMASKHRRDPLSGLVMPGSVKLNFPKARLSLRLDLGNVRINQLSGDPAELWSLPHYEGAPMVDLASPGFQPPPAAAATRPTPSRNRLLR
jgi:hypothetical protein